MALSLFTYPLNAVVLIAFQRFPEFAVFLSVKKVNREPDRKPYEQP